MPRVELLSLPRSLHEGAQSVDAAGGVVIVGANGSGKTRLGAWIELSSPHQSKVHRVSAQRSLAFPVRSSTSALSVAQADLLYGSGDATGRNGAQYKSGHRWSGNPVTNQLNDYQKLTTYLFTEEFEQSTKYRQLNLASRSSEAPPETKLDKIRRIWEDVLPHRTLRVGAGMVEASTNADVAMTYNASEMSDGERVVFYSIGQALAAPEEAIVVIDEPELHLHRSIQARLWDAIERERGDCLFVYITHDLEFAASRVDATKVWVREYTGTDWDWRVLPKDSALPAELLLNVLGSRKPILFCEGERGSLDEVVYGAVYPDATVVPVGNCEAVIHATASFRSLDQLHHMKCAGIVDRDQRTDEECRYLAARGVHSLEVAELENALVTDQVVRAIANHLVLEHVDKVVNDAQDILLERLRAQREKVIADRARARIEIELRRAESAGTTRAALIATIDAFKLRLDPGALYDDGESDINDILCRRDTLGALRVLHSKGLSSQIATLLGLQHAEYRKLVLRLLGSSDNSFVRDAVLHVVPAAAMLDIFAQAG